MAENKIELLIKARDEASASLNKLNKEIREIEGASAGASGGLLKLAAGFSAAAVAGAAISKIVDLMRSAIPMGVELSRMAKQLGESAGELSQLSYAAKIGGIELSGMGNTLKVVSKNMYEASNPASQAAKAFNAIGIELDDIKGKKPAEMLELIADRLYQFEDGANKVAVAQKLMGSHGAEWLTVMTKGAAGLRELKEEAEKSGVAIRNEHALALDEAGKALDRWGMKMKVWGAELVLWTDKIWKFREGAKALADETYSVNATPPTLAHDALQRYKWERLAWEAGLDSGADDSGVWSPKGGALGQIPGPKTTTKSGDSAAEKALRRMERDAEKAVDAVRKSVEAKIRLEERGADAVDKIRKAVSDRDERRQERFLRLSEQYVNALRQARERIERAWDAPGTGARAAAANDYAAEKDKLGRMLGLGDITPEAYDELMKQIVSVHKERLAQIADETDLAAARVERLWIDMANGTEDILQGVFVDGFKGKLRSLGDYFESFSDLLRQSFAKAMANMVTEWGIAQARMSMTGGGWIGKLGSWVAGGLGMGVTANAKGAVYDSPQFFRFSRGVGVMAESGPEGILPLARTASGDLGVKIAGGSAGGAPQKVSVEIINETGQPQKVRRSEARFDGQEFVVTAVIDAVNRNAYGLRDVLTGV